MAQEVFVAVGIPLNRDEYKKMQNYLSSAASDAFEGYSPTLLTNEVAPMSYLCFDIWVGYEHDFELTRDFFTLMNLDRAVSAAQAVSARFQLTTDYHLVVYIDESLSCIDLEFIFGTMYQFPGAGGDISLSVLRSRGMSVEDAPLREYVGGAGFGAFKFFTKAILSGTGFYGGWTWTRQEIESAKEDWDLYLPHGFPGGPTGGTEGLAMFEVVKSGTPVPHFRSLVMRMREILQNVARYLTGTFDAGQAGIALWYRDSPGGKIPMPPLERGYVREEEKKLIPIKKPHPIVSKNRAGE